ncbi:MAG: metallophosphoesterase [Spirochaetales bacterium]
MKVLIATDIHLGYSPEADHTWKKKLDSLWREHEYDIEHVILGGDNGSNDPDHEVACLKFASDLFGDAEVRWVPGNHSYWSRGQLTAQEALEAVRRRVPKQGVYYLPDSPLLLPEHKTVFAGFGGWYAESPPSTNDPNWIGDFENSEVFLREHAREGFESALQVCAEKKALGWTTYLVTHFPFFEVVKDKDWKGIRSGGYFGGPLEWEDRLNNVDTVVFGHTHWAFDGLAKNGHTRLFNPGSDYGKPAVLLLDL